MNRSQRTRIMTMVEMALLIALVIALQILSAVMPKIGGFSITLTLIPLIVGAILFGVKGGAVLGFSFGLIVLINCITGLDIGGNILWSANPFLTATICFVKGIAAGVLAAWVYKLVVGKNKDCSARRKYVATVAAAITAPIVNTGLFVVGLVTFFNDILYAWAGDTNALTYIFVGLIGINFIIEFFINVILSPAVVRIIDAVKK